jgi:hypothetical protein
MQIWISAWQGERKAPFPGTSLLFQCDAYYVLAQNAPQRYSQTTHDSWIIFNLHWGNFQRVAWHDVRVHLQLSHGRYSVYFNFKAPWCKSSAGQQANLLACLVFGHNANFPQCMHLLVYNQQISLWNFEANVNIIFNFACFAELLGPIYLNYSEGL